MMPWQPAIGLALSLVLVPPQVEKTIAVDGLVRLIEHVDIPARSDGKIEQFQVKEGGYVRKNVVLGRLNDTEAKLTLKRLELDHQLAVEKANSQYALHSARLVQEVARNEFQRAAQAKQASPNSISITEFDRLRLEAEKATYEFERLSEEKRFALITAESKAVELELGRLAVEERQFVSPLDGIVVQLHHREGEWVHLGEKVIRIVRIDRLRVEAYVNLQPGLATLENAPVTFEAAFGDATAQQFTGEVVFLNPEADPVNGQIRVWAEIENQGRLLRPGQRGRLKITPREKTEKAP